MKKSTSLNLRICLTGVALLLVAGRLALPYVLKSYVNQRLQSIDGYRGEVQNIKVKLFKGAYTATGLRLDKTGGQVPIPFVLIEEMELSLEWEQLIRGKISGKISLNRPSLNFVAGTKEADRQTGVDSSWSQTLDQLYPFTLNRFDIHEGVLRFADPHQNPPVDIYVTNLFAVATNLTNIRTESEALAARLLVQGNTIGGGEVKLDLRLDPLAKAPTFKLAASVTDMELVALNDFMRSYLNVDAQSGKFWMFLNVAGAHGRYRGVAKPFFINFSTLSLAEVRRQDVFKSFWEGLVGALSEVFENQSRDQLATRLEINGTFDTTTRFDWWSSLGGILRNAFLQALQPGIPRPVSLPETDPAPG